jgi:flagellar export protein FliJ
MKRVERLRMVERAIDDIERRRAESLAASEKRLNACTAKLAELEAYHGAYTRQFNERAEAGIGGAGLRDYQTFLARLAEAVRQQTTIVTRARTERDAELVSWQQRRAARRGRGTARQSLEKRGTAPGRALRTARVRRSRATSFPNRASSTWRLKMYPQQATANAQRALQLPVPTQLLRMQARRIPHSR